MLSGYLVASTIVFMLFFLIWANKGHDLIVKIMLFFMSVLGIIVTLQDLGFIIKVG